MISELYSIEVTGDIAAKIRAMAEGGVFAMRGGSVELHFDIAGNISQITTHSYKKLSTPDLIARQS